MSNSDNGSVLACRHPLVGGLLLLYIAWQPAGMLPAQEEDAGDLVPLVVQLLTDADKDMRALGLEQIRTQAPGEAATEKFAALLPDLSAPVQVELLHALTDRGDDAARPAIISLLSDSGEEPVRLAAIRALGFLGQSTDLKMLLKWLSGGSAAEQTAARRSLGRLPGAGISQAIALKLKDTVPTQRIVLMQILVTRRAFDTAADLLPQAVDQDPQVRAAAMTALSQLAGIEQIPGMVQGILAAERGRPREAAEKAVMLVCRRIEDPQQQASPLVAAMEGLSASDKLILLPALGRVGGPVALKIANTALAAPDQKQHEAGLRALCNWPDASVAPTLMKLSQADKHAGHAISALRALIRVAPLPDGRSDMEKLQLLRQALPLCTRDDERKLVLQRASAIRIPETLRFLLPYLDQPDFAEQACLSIVELAHHRSLREPNKAEFDQALEKVKQTSKNSTVLDRADRYQKGQTWVRQ